VSDPTAPNPAGAAAETEPEALARLYDVDLAEDPGDDIALYLALAERTGGPIVELAAGTGRIVRPLAAAGYDITAVDLDPAMLARLQAQASVNVTPVLADLTTWRPPRPAFRLAILGLNALFLMTGRHEQRAALESLAAALVPGGLAVVDIWLPDAVDLARYDQRLLLDYIRTDPASGRTVTKTVAALHDAATTTVLLTSIYDEAEAGQPVTRWIRRDLLRLLGAGELVDFARAAGLEVETLAGDYGLEPLGAGAERAILVARRP
jgi:SAM-dependent methyltransferase